LRVERGWGKGKGERGKGKGKGEREKGKGMRVGKGRNKGELVCFGRNLVIVTSLRKHTCKTPRITRLSRHSTIISSSNDKRKN